MISTLDNGIIKNRFFFVCLFVFIYFFFYLKMGKISSLRVYSRVYSTPRRPFEKERFDSELRLCGIYGLRCKREVYRVHYTLSKLRKRARFLLTLDENDERRVFEGGAMLRRLHKMGVLPEDKNQLDYVLALKHEDFLERRLQTIVFKTKLARSIHHARVLILQRHIRVGKQLVNVPSFLVRRDSEGHVDHSLNSSLVHGRMGRVKRKKAAAAKNKDKTEEEDA